jgi:hypothetical protein
MALRDDGTVFLANPTIGRAMLADPTSGFAPRATMTYPVPVGASGVGPKVALSADGATLYAVGSSSAGGLAAYDVASGALVASYSDKQPYNSVTVLPSGTLLAAPVAGSRLNFFGPSLKPLGAVPCDITVTAVY